jgi:hypothetical protein
MPASNDNHIVDRTVTRLLGSLFHVKHPWTLFPDTESRENTIEHHIVINDPNQPVERAHRKPQFFRTKLKSIRPKAPRTAERVEGLREGAALALMGNNDVLSAGHRGDSPPLDRLD